MNDTGVSSFTTELAYRQRINLVIAYIDDHLSDPLTLEGLARVGGFSPFHFHRIFSAFTGETLAGYVRRQRLGIALAALVSSRRTVTEIALEAGYETPSAFTRAFKQQFHCLPTAVRRDGGAAGGPAAVQAAARGARRTRMQPDIRELPELRVIYVRKKGLVGNNFNAAADQAFSRLCAFLDRERLWPLVDTKMCLGICPDEASSTLSSEQRYDACFPLKPGAEVRPRGEVKLQTLPAGKYAVFQHKGPYESLWQSWNIAYRDWVPASGLELRDAPPFEVYLNDKNRVPAADLLTEIYIPIA